jgi:nucleoside-diphosphate-sugar epimerase
VKLFVTGASGFLGAAVVDAAEARGHEVVRLVRRATSGQDGSPRERVVDAVGDVRDTRAWEAALDGVDAVVHLAAAKAGDFHTQFASTVLGTEALLDAMSRHGVRRLVHVSTFSVYDYRALPTGAVLDETSPVEARPQDRDDYAQTKLVQEQLVRDFAAAGGEVTIVRPGAVYGPGNLWNAGLAAVLPGGLGLAFAPRGRLKLTYVENCAEAIMLAAERVEAIGCTINVVDDDLPSQRAFAKALARHGVPVPRSVPVPWVVARALATALAVANRRFAGGRAKFPGIVVPAKLDAQYRPLRYTNDTARRVLGWRPRYGLDEALARSVAPAPAARELVRPGAVR